MVSADALLSEVRERCRRYGLAPNAGARRRFGRNLAELSDAQAAELLAALRALDDGPKLEAEAPANRHQTATGWKPGGGIGPAPAVLSCEQAAAWCAARAERYPMEQRQSAIPHGARGSGGANHGPV